MFVYVTVSFAKINESNMLVGFSVSVEPQVDICRDAAEDNPTKSHFTHLLICGIKFVDL